jgi:hypothetical protein
MTLILRLSCLFALAVVTVQAQSGTESRRQLIAPTHDRYARVEDVRAAVQPIQGVTLETPMDINRFGRKSQARVLDWLEQVNR